LEIENALVDVTRFKIHKVERQRGLGQSVANVEHIASCVSQTLKLAFDDIQLDGVIEMAQDHPVGSFAPRLLSMLHDVVVLELFNQPTVGIRGVNIDFDRFIRERFAVVLLLLKSGSEVGHHILIVAYAVHIYGRRLVFQGLLGAEVPAVAGRSSCDVCMSSSERWESSSKWFREVNGDEAPG
jgi:hypothetical protein